MGRAIVNNSVNKQMLKKGGKKHLIKAQKGIYKGDPGFTITPPDSIIKKSFNSDPGFVKTPSDSAIKKYKPKTSKDGYVQYQKGGKKHLSKAQTGIQTGKPIQVVSIENGKRTYGTPAVDSVGYNNFVKEQQEKGQKKGTLGKIKGMFGLKKGGSTKVKKYQDGGPTTLGKTMTRSVKIKKSGEEKEISDKRYDRIKNRMSNRAGTAGMSGQKIEDGITTTDEAFRSKSGRKAIGRRTVTYKKGGSIKSKSKK